ncbi:hypothetical protein LY13_004295, partial [Prauserella aidingensis]|nr:hypothetical protein [Prauserella aidingensis]
MLLPPVTRPPPLNDALPRDCVFGPVLRIRVPVLRIRVPVLRIRVPVLRIRVPVL